MKIKELVDMLGISRANIRFYEQEGLLNPERKENQYRDYNGDDIERLKKIIVLRKLGISISDIKAILDKKIQLMDLMENHIQELKLKIEELNGAVVICEEIEKKSESIDEMDSTYYLGLIQGKEQNGLSFSDILNDWVNFEKDHFFKMWKYVFFFNLEKIKNKHSIKTFIIILFIICVLRGLSYHYLWKSGSFWMGFFYPFIVFAGVTLLVLPIFLLNIKFPKLAQIISAVLLILSSIILIGIFLLVIVLSLNHWLHFWF